MTKKIGVAEILAAACALNEDVAWHEDKIKRQRMRIHTLTKGLRRRLEKGETTGDRLQDLVLHIGGGVGDPLLPRLRELESVLKGKKGQFVLLHFDAKVPDRHTFGRGYSHRSEECYRLGVLEGEELDIVKNKSSFYPEQLSVMVSKYIQGTPFPMLNQDLVDLNLKVQDGNIFERKHGGFHPGNPKVLVELLQHNDWQRVIVVGDDAVGSWLHQKTMKSLFTAAGIALGKIAPDHSKNFG